MAQRKSYCGVTRVSYSKTHKKVQTNKRKQREQQADLKAKYAAKLSASARNLTEGA